MAAQILTVKEIVNTYGHTYVNTYNRRHFQADANNMCCSQICSKSGALSVLVMCCDFVWQKLFRNAGRKKKFQGYLRKMEMCVLKVNAHMIIVSGTHINTHLWNRKRRCMLTRIAIQCSGYMAVTNKTNIIEVVR